MLKTGGASSCAYYSQAEIIQYRCPACRSTTVEVIERDLCAELRVVDGGTRDYFAEEEMRCAICRHQGWGHTFEWRARRVKSPEEFHACCEAWERDEADPADRRHRFNDIVYSWEGRSYDDCRTDLQRHERMLNEIRG